MFTIRSYTEKDAAACAECFFEGFFTGTIDENDRALLLDWTMIMIEKSNFTFVAEAEDHTVAGFVSGKYNAGFDKALAGSYMTKKHYGVWCRCFFKYYLKRYKMSDGFKPQFEAFYRQAQERNHIDFGNCDLELAALSSKKDYRKGIGTELVDAFMEKAKTDGAGSVRLFTNTLATYTFYDKYGFTKVAEKDFKDDSRNKSFVYEYRVGA